MEINAIALAKSADGPKVPVKCEVDPQYEGHVAAVRAGDLFLSGLMAADANGISPQARRDPRQPYFDGGAGAEARVILEKARTICEAAGALLGDVVRIQQFHTDLSDFHSVYAAWQECLPGSALPVSAIEVPTMAVPGCSLLMDIWIYAPRR